MRHAIRALLKSPSFTMTVLATLTLAIGANVAIFTLANALLLASLPVPRADRLVRISRISTNGQEGNLSIPAFRMIQQQTGLFTGVLAWNGGGMETLEELAQNRHGIERATRRDSEFLSCVVARSRALCAPEINGVPFAGSVDDVAGDYYGVLGIKPALGRFLNADDIGLEHFTPSRVAVLGYDVWRDRFQKDPAVLGKTILINGKPYTVIGVHPALVSRTDTGSFRGRDDSGHFGIDRGAFLRPIALVLYRDRTAARGSQRAEGARADRSSVAIDTAGDGATERA